MSIRCQLVKEREPRPSNLGGTPCELCIVLEEMGKEINKLAKIINTSEPLKLYNKALKHYRIIANSHHTCAGCGLCFGGYHIAFPDKTIPTIGDVCQWCYKVITKIGVDEFKQRMKRKDYNEPEEYNENNTDKFT